jgi:3-keto-disaccharide hydrolase
MSRSSLRMVACAACWLLLGGGVKAEEKEKGFVPLFNGKDLTGWVVKGKAEGWKVKEGVIRSEGAAGGDWLRSDKEYGDFILKLDWKVSKDGNSGVFLRVPDKGAPWQTGYEVQISNAPRDEKHCTGALYGYAAVKPRPDESADKWHTFELHCVGSKIKVVADGVTVVDVDQTKLTAPDEKGYTDPKTKSLKGYIGLQDSHAPAGSYIEFGNVRIKELKPASDSK